VLTNVRWYPVDYKLLEIRAQQHTATIGKERPESVCTIDVGPQHQRDRPPETFSEFTRARSISWKLSPRRDVSTLWRRATVPAVSTPQVVTRSLKPAAITVAHAARSTTSLYLRADSLINNEMA